MPREETLVAHDGTRLAWQSWSPEAPPRATIVLIHGGAEHGGRYGRLVSPSSPAAFWSWRPTCAGTGARVGVAAR